MRNLKKYCVLVTTTAMLTLLAAGSAFAGQWTHGVTNATWKYKLDNGKFATGWQLIEKDGSEFWYFFDSYGVMDTGWIYSDGKEFFTNENGQMVTNTWIDKKGTGKVFVGNDGSVLKNGTTPNGIPTDELGRSTINEDELTSVATGPGKNIAVSTSTPSQNGEEYSEQVIISGGFVTDANGRWFKNSDGSRFKNEWKTINKKKYYFNNDGYALTGFQTIDGSKYNFKEDGVLVTYTFTENNIQYTVDKATGKITGEKAVTPKKTFVIETRSDDFNTSSETVEYIEDEVSEE